MSFTLGHANIQQTDNARDEAATVDELFDHADVITWNEARDAGTLIRNRPGWKAAVAGGLGISWKTDKFELVDHGSRVVMQGGHVGADGHRGGDDRRVGPSRLVLWVVLREKATGRLVLIATHHTVARADTVAKWRRGIRARGWGGVVVELVAARRKYPSAKLILTGDFNTIGAITAFVSLGVREAKTPATHGRARYDRIFGAVSNIRTLVTRSDHRALLATVTLTGAIDPAPVAPVLPAKPVKAKPRMTARQRRRLARLERIARPGGRKLRPFQRRALARLRRLRRNSR